MPDNNTLPKLAMQQSCTQSPADVADCALNSLTAIFQYDDTIELRAIEPDGPSLSLCGRLSEPAERAALAEFITKWDGKRNLYFGCNPRRPELAGTSQAGKAEDILARRSLVLDLDKKDASHVDPNWSRTVDAIQSELNPAMVLNSGNGYHIWLPVDDVPSTDVEGTTATLKAAMARLGADNMADAPRVVRLPYTQNIPTASKLKRGATQVQALPVHGYENPTPYALRTSAPDVASVCSTLFNLACNLSLPGNAGQNATSLTATSDGVKRGHPAPSADLLRLLLDNLPNQPGGPFEDRDKWVEVALAVKGAAEAGAIKAEGREAFLDWSSRWGGNHGEAERVWDTAHNPHTGWGTLMQMLKLLNPDGAKTVKLAVARAVFDVEASNTQVTIGSLPLAPFQQSHVTNIPPRPFFFGTHVHKGTVSLLVAPGGTGKSALTLTECLAMAVGKDLIGGNTPRRKLTVLSSNLEDDTLELSRRVVGAMWHYNLTDSDIGNRLILSGAENPTVQLARMGQNGPEPVPGIVDALVEMLTTKNVDVWVIDPLSRIHTLNENDNIAANVVMEVLRQVATRADVAIIAVHHTSKVAGREIANAGMTASRGASAFTDAARHVRQLATMTEKQARDWGVPVEERWRYVAVQNGKNNLASRASDQWFRLVSVKLNNGADLWPEGDTVQVVEDWKPPAALKPTVSDLSAVVTAIKKNPDKCRKDPKSDQWIGYLVAETLGMNIGPVGGKQSSRPPDQNVARSNVSEMLRRWDDEGLLLVVKRQDGERKPRPYYEVSPEAESAAGLENLGLIDPPQDAEEQ